MSLIVHTDVKRPQSKKTKKKAPAPLLSAPKKKCQNDAPEYYNYSTSPDSTHLFNLRASSV